jgi:hypothetical protein
MIYIYSFACLSSSLVPYVVRFSGVSIIDSSFDIL